MKFFKTLSITIFALILLSATASQAQCPMCKASVESNLKDGGNTGKGLNSGIMYLLAAPYLAMAGIGFLWYKKFKKKNVDLSMKQERLNLN
ncbi:MAG: hypothetical protein EAY66_08315 [Sphingobacteriales bacterium]|nr:MAG: hypothetical protein EAY66_08315 [Sphingobacteriales bacterium]